LQAYDPETHPKPDVAYPATPGFLRRVGAILYDTLLLLAVLFFATALIRPFISEQAFASQKIYYQLYLLLVSYSFYGWFWTHGGQTLGLRAWKIRVCNFNGGSVTWKQATIRFGAALISWACLGLGFFWSLIAKNKLCWHDQISQTRLQWAPGEKSGQQN
jgi:uncharacterized RDD family membrane protein YckC